MGQQVAQLHDRYMMMKMMIKAQRFKWLGHIQWMDQGRPTRKLLDWRPMGTRPIGRPRQRWKEDGRSKKSWKWKTGRRRL